jgi:hypothetical protein
MMNERSKPYVGLIVLYYEGDAEAGSGGQGTNGTRFHPAIVTRVWSATCVNLQVLFDASKPMVRTSMCELPDTVFAEGMHCPNSGWRWLPRS